MTHVDKIAFHLRLAFRKLFSSARASKMTQQQSWKYPVVRRDESVKQDHFGTIVADPYRWLEDPDSEETKAFVAAQNEITQPYLAACEVRDKFKDRYSEMRIQYNTTRATGSNACAAETMRHATL